MKNLLILSTLILSAFVSPGQSLTLNDFLSITLTPATKPDNRLLDYGFVSRGRQYEGDTTVFSYSLRRIVSEPGKLTTITRKSISRYDIAGESSVLYKTNLPTEFAQIKDQAKRAGFICYTETDSIIPSDLLYQKEDMTVHAFKTGGDDSMQYAFHIKRKLLPRLKNIRYAEDLLQFTSHEYLAYVFGEKNVKKDVYFFSENELAKCSVLFLNTDRQVVFLWEDGTNNCKLSNLLIGGQQMLKSSMEHNNFVGQNTWRLKNGMHAGMTLYELRMLNGQDFKFYSGNSDQIGMVLADNTGKINFEQQGVILGCMNCRDSKFLTTSVMSAEEALSEERILFVLSIILTPVQPRP